MEVFGIGQYQAAPNSYAPQKGEAAVPANDTKAAPETKDTVTISENARRLQALRKQFPEMRSGPEAGGGYAQRLRGIERATALGESLPKAEAPQERNDVEAEEDAGGGDMTGTSGCVGINAAKLARMLAAAKTRAQVQAVIAKIEADLKECEAGKARGMDVDEASVQAAEQLLQEAKSRLASADDREATPQEEIASALASLM